jgi:hypothetical protein
MFSSGRVVAQGCMRKNSMELMSKIVLLVFIEAALVV